MQIAVAHASPNPLVPAVLGARPGDRPDGPGGLRVPGRTIRVHRDAEIYAQGSGADCVYRVLSGAVRTCKLMPDGRRQVGEFALPGDLFGLDAIGAHFYAAEAVVETQLVCYSRRALEEHAAHDHATGRALQRITLQSLSAAHKRIVMLGRKTALERVASFLLEMQERTAGGEAGLILPMSRQDIADHLGLTVETVSRTLATLKQRGVVALPDAHCIRIVDRRALEFQTGEHDALVH